VQASADEVVVIYNNGAELWLFVEDMSSTTKRQYGIIHIKNSRIRCSACKFRGCAHKRLGKNWMRSHESSFCLSFSFFVFPR
jgi:hypothetical protein